MAVSRAIQEHNDAQADRPSTATKVGIRDLGRNPSKVIAFMVEQGRPVIVTNQGRPVAVLYPVDEGQVEDFILTHAEQFIGDRELADAALAASATRALTDVLAELDD